MREYQLVRRRHVLIILIRCALRLLPIRGVYNLVVFTGRHSRVPLCNLCSCGCIFKRQQMKVRHGLKASRPTLRLNVSAVASLARDLVEAETTRTPFDDFVHNPLVFLMWHDAHSRDSVRLASFLFLSTHLYVLIPAPTPP